jgi:ribose 5-phosphate isomerase B
MRIALGCDHRGFNLKRAIMSLITEAGHSFEDFGGYDTTSVDYPDIAQKVAEAVAGGRFDYGILVCSTGIGMSIAANKVRGIRAAVCHDLFTARRARQHNDANVLCLGGDVVTQGLGEIVQTFLNTSFEGGRHARRLEKIRAMEAD